MKSKIFLGVIVGSFSLGLLALAAQQLTQPQPAHKSPNADTESDRPLSQADTGFVAHEWGTFTSFQTGDGTLLAWRPLETSQLPKFVYNWQHPGLGRTAMGLLAVGKGGLTSLQRMETPVIYFYAAGSRNVDVSVKFPEGNITEWYPQAGQVGPALIAPGNSEPGTVSAASSESMIRWPDVHITAGSEKGIPSPAGNGSGSHYFAARETDASMLQPGDTPAETEKFLFYRGIGNFSTPLRVTMKSDDGVDIANTGGDTLSHLFVLAIKNGAGSYFYVPELKPGEVRVVVISAEPSLSIAQFSDRLVADVSAALAKTGLYPREAAAMANTWKDSWFSEQGVRVLYALPRSWTDHTLPMNMNPAPKELVRTMVGRAEVLPPGVEANLVSLMVRAKQGDQLAAGEARDVFKSLGRFASPAFNEALGKIAAQPTELAVLAKLLPATPAVN